VAAPTNEIAIGRKMIDLEIFSQVGDSLSASTATARPIATVRAGTMKIHKTLLMIVSWKFSSPSTSV
jgi:hypothetical protein